MENFTGVKHTSFYAIGLSYKKADAEMRGKFSLNETTRIDLLKQAKEEHIESLFVTEPKFMALQNTLSNLSNYFVIIV